MCSRHLFTEFLSRRLVRLLVRSDATRIGRRIREGRNRQGMGLAALARRSGLEEGDLRRWERGDLAGFDSFAVELIARALRRTCAWLLTGAPEPEDIGEALCRDPTVSIISRVEDIPCAATRRRMARYLLFVAVTGQRPRVPPHLEGVFGKSVDGEG